MSPTYNSCPFFCITRNSSRRLHTRCLCIGGQQMLSLYFNPLRMVLLSAKTLRFQSCIVPLDACIIPTRSFGGTQSINLISCLSCHKSLILGGAPRVRINAPTTTACLGSRYDNTSHSQDSGAGVGATADSGGMDINVGCMDLPI